MTAEELSIGLATVATGRREAGAEESVFHKDGHMVLFLSVILIAVVAGYLAGGRFRGLARLRLAYWWLAPLGLGLRDLPLPSFPHETGFSVRVAALAASYLVLLGFAAVNHRMAGMSLIFVGLSFNALVVVSNGGMPVSRHALDVSGQSAAIKEFGEDAGSKHHVMTPADHLTPLADVIPIPAPIGDVASVGDVFVYAGLAWLIQSAMRLWTEGHASEVEPARYRGKHRPGSARAPASAPAEVPAAAEPMMWGT
jgi:hypothetical protein